MSFIADFNGTYEIIYSVVEWTGAYSRFRAGDVIYVLSDIDIMNLNLNMFLKLNPDPDLDLNLD